MSEFYWELIQFDGTRIDVPPSLVDTIKRRMASGEPINTKTMSIPANQIKTFRRSEKRFGEQNLIESASRAFKEPMITQDNTIVSKWVKKEVTNARYDSYYSKQPSYKRLASEAEMTTIAFRLPIHTITEEVDECNEDEVLKLEKM